MGPQLELAEQLFFAEGIVADDIDLLDTRRQALGDLNAHRHPIAFQRGYRGLDAHAVLAEGEILLLELLLDTVEDRAVEHPALRQANVLQPLL